MTSNSPSQGEWVNGFLFVGNHLALDFLNTKPILDVEPRELLPDGTALERWLIAVGLVTSREDRTMVRAWCYSRRGNAFVRKLVGYRERLRAAVLQLEKSATPADIFLLELNELLRKYPQRVCVVKNGSRITQRPFFEPRKPEDVWAPIIAATVELLSHTEIARIRKCESETCVVHFYDTSKKGSRRWCSMNLCGNRVKVAAYQERLRHA